LAIDRLALELEDSQLLNHLPDFIDELRAAARDPAQGWDLECARSHGRQRMRIGVDIGSLTIEMALVGEALIGMIGADGLPLHCDEMQLVSRLVGEATAASVSAYAQMRDKQLAQQAAQHFSFIAHEIRNPLHNAQMAAMLSNASRTAELHSQNVERLQRALTQLADLVDNSLLQARLFGDPCLNMERHEVTDLVAAVRNDVTAHAEARGLTVTIDAQPFAIAADRKLLVSALTNVVRNAIKFTHDGGEIKLRVQQTDGRARFEVKDQCGGLPEDLPERLFRPFVQAGNDTSGFGLGLAIVKQAVDAHRGSVQVINHPNDGCTFVLELPIQQSPELACEGG
jgi:signal transduction histidine kinase